MHATRIPTKLGTFTARFTEGGLAAIDFPERTKTNGRNSDPSETLIASAKVARWKRQTASALKRVLEGRRPGPLPPLDWSQGTEFQRRVWSALLDIAPGNTRSYSEIARIIGQPRSARAVGGACGANPIPVLVPCHRVLAAGGRLGGFSGGLDWKRRLLAREGAIRFTLAPG
jgi:methylated-DNA-[protein]-cysteine S-methyltransferase